jgi:hypothetical protein
MASIQGIPPDGCRFSGQVDGEIAGREKRTAGVVRGPDVTEDMDAWDVGGSAVFLRQAYEIKRKDSLIDMLSFSGGIKKNQCWLPFPSEV